MTKTSSRGSRTSCSRAGHEFGEAELLWRCADCGEVGDVDEIPDGCPSCGADRTALYYWTED